MPVGCTTFGPPSFASCPPSALALASAARELRGSRAANQAAALVVKSLRREMGLGTAGVGIGYE